MDDRNRKVLKIIGIIFGVIVIVAIIVAIFIPKLPSTQNSDKTVIIDNYAEYTEHISSDSFGYLGNYLYEFVKDPSKGVYHAEIVDGSYTYASESWFSKFIVKMKDSDISWKISMQTLNTGEINGDIAVTCETGNCASLNERMNSSRALQDLLPITDNDYLISQGTSDYNTLSILYYDYDNVGKTKALEKITSLGFKPEDYKIEYFYGGR